MAVAAVSVLVALLWHRPDLLVLACPFVVVAVWSVHDRPSTSPAIAVHPGERTLHEGEGTTWSAAVAGPDVMDLAVAAMPAPPWLDRRPASGVATRIVRNGAVEVALDVCSTRWGRRSIPPVHLAVATSWAAFRWTATTPASPLVTLPLPAVFDAAATFRPSDGLVGLNRSVRAGDGAEFAGIRPFQAADRLRRINWPRSSRTGSLQVNATWADQDTHVMLIVDAGSEVGVSGGVAGHASSLDMTVRAAGAIAEHYVLRGERVSLRVFGSTSVPSLRPATGRDHLRRILEALTFIEPTEMTSGRHRVDPWLLHTTDRVLAIMLSPLVTAHALDSAIAVGRAGTALAVVDTLPAELGHRDEHYELAWRIRLLERRQELRAMQETGIPVVAWRGPGSLDQFLRDVTRRARAPRLRRR